MAKQALCTIVFALLPIFAAFGQDEDPDVDSALVIDTAEVVDSLPADSLDTVSDTLSEREKVLERVRKRLAEDMARKEQASRAPLSIVDSMAAYILPARMNRRELIDRSFYHDPSDYFKFDPGYFDLDYQDTPMRNIIYPYGLAGDRLRLLYDGYPIRPFGHVLEPDGLVDLNDMPSGLDDEVFILPGQSGRLFGGGHGVATLYTRAVEPDSIEPVSAFLVDRGSFAYSLARGRYSKRFEDYRDIEVSLGYRNSDGSIGLFNEESYHIYGDLYWPFGDEWGLEGTGHVYDRQTRLGVRTDIGGVIQPRDRFDRSFNVGVVRHNDIHTRRSSLGYTHRRKASFWTQAYRANFDLTGHGAYASREWASGARMFRLDGTLDYLEYEFGELNETASRWSGEASMTVAAIGDGLRYAIKGGVGWDEEYDVLPHGTLVLSREGESVAMLATAGYSERAPSLEEINMPREEAAIYDNLTFDYADFGNPDLEKERQAVGSFDLMLGDDAFYVNTAVAGGRIFDGIDWVHRQAGGLTEWFPENGDVDFASATLTQGLRISDFLRWHNGASYHWLDYELFGDDRAYTPDYLLFSGMELHVYWRQKLIDLFAYGEIVYTGPYDGYVQTGLGQVPIANIKLSFQMGSFRFHYVQQNVFSRLYDARDYLSHPGRFNYWGFVWTFLN